MSVNGVNNVENQNRVSTGKSALLGGAVGATGGWLYGNHLLKHDKGVQDAFLKAAEDIIDKTPNISDSNKFAKRITKIVKRAIKASSALVWGVMGAGLFAAGAAIYNKIRS